MLVRRNLRVVFAESCTAGLVAATLARVPGISAHLCGSAVTYCETTKVAWLDVRPRDLARHSAVSPQVARQMALGVLAHTPEADWSAAVTGHLGPEAPAEQDGVIYICIARRLPSGRLRHHGTWRFDLTVRARVARQRQAAAQVLAQLGAAIEAS